MATKKLKTVEIHQMLDSAVLTVADTADDMKASMVISQFEGYGDLEWKDGDVTKVVPYHAVQYIKVTEAEAEYDKADPYYCEEETEGGN